MRVHNVLFVCTGNSARSIIAEALLNHLGKPRFRAYSAGSDPSGEVNPLVVEYLRQQGIDTAGARSKSWDEFDDDDAPLMDFVITVCDRAAGETCPVWPGRPAHAHWSSPDPAPFMQEPDEARKVIRDVFQVMHRRIQLLVALPIEKLDWSALQGEARAIAHRA